MANFAYQGRANQTSDSEPGVIGPPIPPIQVVLSMMTANCEAIMGKQSLLRIFSSSRQLLETMRVGVKLAPGVFVRACDEGIYMLGICIKRSDQPDQCCGYFSPAIELKTIGFQAFQDSSW